MDALRTKARELLAAGAVQLVVGYAAGSEPGRTRPCFVRTPAEADGLIWNEHCRQNLATYLQKPEVRAFGRVALVARPSTLRALLQLAAESQLGEGRVVALFVTDDGAVAELPTLTAIEEAVAQLPRGLTAAEYQELERIAALPRAERWAFWAGEFARCIKCYACRAACPLCYCARCITEANQPQWIPVSSDPLGNLEWNVVRAMHLAGRCIDCGSCSAACPEGLRLDLLNRALAEEVRTQFGAEPGLSLRKDYALASFKPDDKQEYIR